MDKLFTVKYVLPKLTIDQVTEVRKQFGSASPMLEDVYVELQNNSYTRDARYDICDELYFRLMKHCPELSSISKEELAFDDERCELEEQLQVQQRVIKFYKERMDSIAGGDSGCPTWQHITVMKGCNRKLHFHTCERCKLCYSYQHSWDCNFKDILEESDAIVYVETQGKISKLQEEISTLCYKRKQMRGIVTRQRDNVHSISNHVCKHYVKTQLHLTTDPNVVCVVGDVEFSVQELGQALFNLKSS